MFIEVSLKKLLIRISFTQKKPRSYLSLFLNKCIDVIILYASVCGRLNVRVRWDTLVLDLTFSSVLDPLIGHLSSFELSIKFVLDVNRHVHSIRHFTDAAVQTALFAVVIGDRVLTKMGNAALDTKVEAFERDKILLLRQYDHLVLRHSQKARIWCNGLHDACASN